jgi:hypothetical protein
MTDIATAPKPKRQGNWKAGPGRPPGSKNKKTLALEVAVQQVAASIDGAFEGDAHAFLQAVYRDPGVPLEIRIMAAGRALRVEKPALSATHGRMDVTFDIAERMDAARKRVARIGGPRPGCESGAALVIDVSPGEQERA